jgi:phospholipase/carboxylesterase
MTNKMVKLVEDEIKERGDSKKVFLAGFSQGSLLSLNIKSHLKSSLGGLVLIGGFKAPQTEITDNAEYENTLIIHGKKDEMVKWSDSEKSYEKLLKKKGVDLVLYDDMEHNLYSSEMKAKLHDFVRERAPLEK